MIGGAAGARSWRPLSGELKKRLLLQCKAASAKMASNDILLVVLLGLAYNLLEQKTSN